MGRKRKTETGLPQRLFFRHGAYYYVHRVGNEVKWEPMGKDAAWAIHQASQLNEIKRKQRLKILGALRCANETIRAAVTQRAGFACVYCGSTSDLGIDHVIPYSDGGSSLPFNLVAACAACNATKGDGDPREFILRLLGAREEVLAHVRKILEKAPSFWTEISRNGAPGRS